MHIFVIGATGQVGSRVVRRMIEAGHSVCGFARHTKAADQLSDWGAIPFVGDLADLDAVIAQARRADAIVFAPQLDMETEYMTVARLLEALAGTGKTFIFTSGTGVLGQRTAGAWHEDSYAEDDDIPFSRLLSRRVETEFMVRASAAEGVRGMVLRPPSIWGHGLYSVGERLLASFEKTGAVCYIGEGLNGYSTVHVDDLADLYLLALERGTAGALYHASSGEINNRCLAELLAKRLDCQTRSVSMDEAIEIWGKFSTLIVLATSSRSRSPRSRSELGWTPTRTNIVDAILHDPLRAG